MPNKPAGNTREVPKGERERMQKLGHEDGNRYYVHSAIPNRPIRLASAPMAPHTTRTRMLNRGDADIQVYEITPRFNAAGERYKFEFALKNYTRAGILHVARGGKDIQYNTPSDSIPSHSLANYRDLHSVINFQFNMNSHDDVALVTSNRGIELPTSLTIRRGCIIVGIRQMRAIITATKALIFPEPGADGDLEQICHFLMKSLATKSGPGMTEPPTPVTDDGDGLTAAGGAEVPPHVPTAVRNIRRGSKLLRSIATKVLDLVSGDDKYNTMSATDTSSPDDADMVPPVQRGQVNVELVRLDSESKIQRDNSSTPAGAVASPTAIVIEGVDLLPEDIERNAPSTSMEDARGGRGIPIADIGDEDDSAKKSGSNVDGVEHHTGDYRISASHGDKRHSDDENEDGHSQHSGGHSATDNSEDSFEYLMLTILLKLVQNDLIREMKSLIEHVNMIVKVKNRVTEMQFERVQAAEEQVGNFISEVQSIHDTIQDILGDAVDLDSLVLSIPPTVNVPIIYPAIPEEYYDEDYVSTTTDDEVLSPIDSVVEEEEPEEQEGNGQTSEGKRDAQTSPSRALDPSVRPLASSSFFDATTSPRDRAKLDRNKNAERGERSRTSDSRVPFRANSEDGRRRQSSANPSRSGKKGRHSQGNSRNTSRMKPSSTKHRKASDASDSTDAHTPDYSAGYADSYPPRATPKLALPSPALGAHPFPPHYLLPRQPSRLPHARPWTGMPPYYGVGPKPSVTAGAMGYWHQYPMSYPQEMQFRSHWEDPTTVSRGNKGRKRHKQAGRDAEMTYSTYSTPEMGIPPLSLDEPAVPPLKPTQRHIVVGGAAQRDGIGGPSDRFESHEKSGYTPYAPGTLPPGAMYPTAYTSNVPMPHGGVSPWLSQSNRHSQKGSYAGSVGSGASYDGRMPITHEKIVNVHFIEERNELEELLEHASTDLNSIVAKMRLLQTTLNAQRKRINLSLATSRNRLMLLQIFVSSITMAMAACSMVSGWFGMNLANGWCGPEGCSDDSGTQPDQGYIVFVTIIGLSIGVSFTFSAVTYYYGFKSTKSGR